MGRGLIVAGIGLACGLCLCAPVLAQRTELRFAVSRDDARCVLDHQQRYSAISRDPVILFLPLCPDVDPAPGQVARLNRNLRVRERRPGPPPPRSVVVLSRRQLSCFLQQLRNDRRRARRGATVAIDLRGCR